MSGPPGRILAIVPFFPMPQNGGDPVRRLLLLQALARRAPLTVLALRRADTTDADVADLRAALPDAEVRAFELGAGGRADLRGRVLRTALGISRRVPPWVVGQTHPDLAAAARAAAPGHDLAVLVGEGAGAYSGDLAGLPFVWDKSNVLLASDVDAVVNGGSPAARLRGLATAPLSYGFESRVIRRAGSVWVTSEDERARLLRHYRPRRVEVVASAVELPREFAARNAALPYRGGPVTAVWLSSFTYQANWSGLRSFLRAAATMLRAGELRLIVVGSGGTPGQLRQLRRLPGIDVRGYVADLAPVLGEAHVAVVPVWAGAGIKMKTLTLLAHGIPTVATPVALEGLPREVAAGVAERPADFPRLLAALDGSRLDAVAPRAAEVVAAAFSIDAFDAAVGRALHEEQRAVD